MRKKFVFTKARRRALAHARNVRRRKGRGGKKPLGPKRKR